MILINCTEDETEIGTVFEIIDVDYSVQPSEKSKEDTYTKLAKLLKAADKNSKKRFYKKRKYLLKEN